MPAAHILQEINGYISNEKESAHNISTLVWSSYKAKYNLILNWYSETPPSFIIIF